VAAIEVDGLVVRYGDITAVDGATFDVDHGEVVALLGPNGAGKTSTVETTEGFRRPTAGAVRVLGLDPIADRRRLLAHRTRSMWRHLSGGEQQRLSLALALVGRPEVAFLDEPTAGVDVTGRQLVRQVVQDLAADGVAVLLTTHDLAEAERVADRVVIIDHGRVAAVGTPTELMTADQNADIRFGAPPGLDTAALGKVLVAKVDEESPGEYRVDAPPTPANIAAITAWLAERDLPLADLRAGRQRLEDVFLSLTQITGEHQAIRVDDHPADAERLVADRGRGRRLHHHERLRSRRDD